MKYRPFLTIIFLTTLLCSCEYPLNKEYFREVEEPAPSHPITLEFSEEADTIFLFQKTEISYDFDTKGLDIIAVRFTMEEKSWEFYTAKGSFFLDPKYYSDGFHELHAELYTNSGSGSIADIAGGEGYYASRTWTVWIGEIGGGYDAPVLQMRNSMTEEGYLKIEWDKCSQFNLSYYYLVLPDYSAHKITKQDSTVYIDKKFVGGTKKYSLTCVVEGATVNESLSEMTVSAPIPQLFFEDRAPDSLLIYWHHPDNPDCVFFIQEGVNTLALNYADTSVMVSYPGFKSISYKLICYQMNDDLTSSYACSSNRTYSLDRLVAGGSQQELRYAFNTTEKVLYAFTEDSLFTFDQQLNRINGIRIETSVPGVWPAFSSAPKSPGICVLNNDQLLYFPYRDLYEQTSIPLGSTFNNVTLTGERILVSASNLGSGIPDSLVIIDSATQKPILRQEFGTKGKIVASPDGRYIAYLSDDDQFSMYEVQDGSLLLKYSKYCFAASSIPFAFDAADTSRFYIKPYTQRVIEMRSCEDYSLYSSMDMAAITDLNGTIVFYNTDPVSGYLFIAYGGDYYYVLDMENEEVKFKVPSEYFYQARLFDNRIYSKDKKYLDVANFLDQ
ncbi:MAG: hypothetical protein ACOYXB_12125 [Bacteroidota bacterium]